MKIAVIGPGSMGLLYGGKLSKCADVTLFGNNRDHIREINGNGVTMKREDSENHYDVKAVLNGQDTGIYDLVILFTKSYLTETALTENQSIIGPNTYLLTLQNGAGHENVLKKFVDEKRVLLGTTAQGSSRENAHVIVNSGLGDTSIGAFAPCDENSAFLQSIKNIFESAGFPCVISDNIRQMIWNKLMINASSSVLSGVLQVKQGYIAENPDAFEMCKSLISDICTVANAEGMCFDTNEQINRLYTHLKNAPDGLTSIYADLKNGRKTEVDYISGAVVKAAIRNNIDAPSQAMIVRMVHAMEGLYGNK
jgi:2-dehydropantoate 2-reductase